MSLIQIVDADDNVIGVKERSKVNYEKDIYRVSALWITNSKGEVLLAKRKNSKDKDPGKWGPAAAGTVESGETYKTNIYKEAEEEIGLTGVRFEIGPKIRVSQNTNYFGQWFTAVIDWPADKFKIQQSEVEQVSWVPKNVLLKDLDENPSKYIPSLLKVVSVLNI